MDFAYDGTLYITQWLTDSVVAISSAGVATTFATGVGRPVAVQVDDAHNRLFVLSESSASVIAIDRSTGAQGNFARA